MRIPSVPDINFIPLSQKGAANGVATLDGSGLIPIGQIPASIARSGANSDITLLTACASVTSSGALGLSAGGSNQNVTITPSGTGYTLLNGNVGIGTNTPSQLLHVKSAAAGSCYAVIEQPSATLGKAAGARIKNSGRELFVGLDYTGTSHDTFEIYDITSSALRLAIDSAGNIGLGAAPSYRFDVNSSTTDPAATYICARHVLNAQFNSANVQSIRVLQAQLNFTGAGTHATGEVDTIKGILYCNNTANYSDELYTSNFQSQVVNTANVNRIVNVRSTHTLGSSSGVLTTLTNFLACAPTRTGGTHTVGTAYGIDIEVQKAAFVTSAWGIYQRGASDLNYFAGNVLIGTTSDDGTNKLQVNGGIWGGIITANTYLKAADIRTDNAAGVNVVTVAGAAQRMNAGALVVSSSYASAPPTNGAIISGNVLIGTTSDSGFRLQVKATGTTYSTIAKFYDGADEMKLSLETGGSGEGLLKVGDDYGNVAVQLNTKGKSYFNGGNLLVGTTTDDTTNKLQVVGHVTIDSGSSYKVNNVAVVGARKTGWAAATGTATRTAFDTATVTLSQLAERVKALLDDCISHGLIGA